MRLPARQIGLVFMGVSCLLIASCGKPRAFVAPMIPPPGPRPETALIQAPPPPRLIVLRYNRPEIPHFLETISVPGPPPPRIVARPARPLPSEVRQEPELQEPTEPPAPPITPVPQLGRIVSVEERERHRRLIDQNLTQARSVVARLEARRLTSAQRDSLQRIQSFISQAEDARDTDPIRARNLSSRADVLARDLDERIR